jgi:hypothetical protein
MKNTKRKLFSTNNYGYNTKSGETTANTSYVLDAGGDIVPFNQANSGNIVKSGNTRNSIPKKSNSQFVNVVTGAIYAYDQYQRLSPDVKQNFVNLAQFVRNKIKNSKTKGNNNNKYTQSKGEKKMTNSANDGTHYLMRTPKPQHISLNTGIIPNTYVSDYHDAIQDECAPLHMTSARVEIPDSNVWELNDYFNQIIAFDIQSKAQSNVGFNLNITENFSATQILNAFNCLIRALQYYFYYASIITYHDNPRNKNMGLIFIRNKMTSEDFNNLAKLGRRLSDTPCPPNLMSMLRYLSGNFLSGNNPASPLLKIIPSYANEDMTFKNNELETALADLNSDSVNQVFALMRRAVPHWVPGNLADIPNVPVYDENFKTIFANLPFEVWDEATATSKGWPSNADDNLAIRYNTYSNSLDGAAYALTGCYLSGGFVVRPGLICPVHGFEVTNADTRRSYYVDKGVKRFYTARQFPFVTDSRPETIKLLADSSTNIRSTVHLPGTSFCEGVSVNTIKESSYKTLDWLMSLETIKRGLIKKQIL